MLVNLQQTKVTDIYKWLAMDRTGWIGLPTSEWNIE